MQTSGSCDTPIADAGKCSAAIASLGITGSAADGSVGTPYNTADSYYPHGCSIYAEIDSSKALGFYENGIYFNSYDPAAAASCSTTYYCICAIPSPPPPSPPPTPPLKPAPPSPPPLPLTWLSGPTVMLRTSGKCEIPITSVVACTAAAKELSLKDDYGYDLFASEMAFPYSTADPSGCVQEDPPSGYALYVNSYLATGDCSLSRGCICGLPNVPPSPQPPSPQPPPPSWPPYPAPLHMIATVGGATYEIKGFGRCSQYLTTKADCTRALAAFGFVVYPTNIMDSPYSYYPPCALSTLRPGCQRALIFSAPPSLLSALLV